MLEKGTSRYPSLHTTATHAHDLLEGWQMHPSSRDSVRLSSSLSDGDTDPLLQVGSVDRDGSYSSAKLTTASDTHGRNPLSSPISENVSKSAMKTDLTRVHNGPASRDGFSICPEPRDGLPSSVAPVPKILMDLPIPHRRQHQDQQWSDGAVFYFTLVANGAL